MHPLLALIICPAILSILAVSGRQPASLARLTAGLMWIQTGVAAAICLPRLGHSSAAGELTTGFAMDGTASLFVLLTTIVVTAALAQAVGFFAREAESDHPPTDRSVRAFYLFTALFLISMYGVVSADNLGFLWIAIEATTLLSAPLVYYHRSQSAIEATWKYFIICSVGIAFAFLGTALFYTASQRVGLFGAGSLSIHALAANAAALPHGLLRLGFIFALLGYGTKAGLFPLHSWLPDAHSEAPAPASAILSGALLNCALVALWRVTSLMSAAGEMAFVRSTLLPMGIATVLAGSLFIMRQRDIKRTLAYSSMENVGIMAVAIALTSGSGFVLQAINHSLVKVALFLVAGNLIQQYGTKSIREIRGILAVQPMHGMLLLTGIIAVAGTPPFGSFLAEWQILSTAADSGRLVTVLALCAALAVGFVALSMQAAAMLFGEPESEKRAILKPSVALVPWLLVAASLVLGVMLPPTLLNLFQGMAR